MSIGITSFFVKAAVAALRAFPELNAEIQGDEIVYKHYCDIGIAVGAEGGLVVPVLRNADRMSFAQIELAIRDFATRAADGTRRSKKISLRCTFTITNGGVFGSLMSTPILNPPQVVFSGGKVQERGAFERTGRDPPHDVPCPQLRSPAGRWSRSGAVSRTRQGARRGSWQSSPGELMFRLAFVTSTLLILSVAVSGQTDRPPRRISPRLRQTRTSPPRA